MGAPDPNIAEFTHQAEAFAVAPVVSLAATLDDLVELSGAADSERWLDAPCGAGHVSFALARRGACVVGVDLTPAMVEIAQRETPAASGELLEFLVGDATALDFGDETFDGSLTRFSLHHIADPSAAVSELARVVKRGGTAVLSDHVTDDDPEAADWHNEVERLRDPSHRRSLTAEQLYEIAGDAGLTLAAEHYSPIEIDYSDWLERGSGGVASKERIAQLLSERPQGTKHFRIRQAARPQLGLTVLHSRWRKA